MSVSPAIHAPLAAQRDVPRRSRRIDQVDAALARHPRLALAGVMLIAVVIRVVYFAQVNAGPLYQLHEWKQSDMAYYEAWANNVLAGDALTRHLDPPLHYWHQQVADGWLEQRPQLEADLLRRAAAQGITDPVKKAEFTQRAVWQEWIGADRFYQEPAYAYLVALTYRVFAHDARWVFAWQMLLGVVNVALVFQLTIGRFGALAATLASLGAAIATPTLMYEATLLRDPLICTLALVLALLTDRAVARGRTRDWALLGLCLGASLLVKGTFLLYAMGLVGYLVLASRRDVRRVAIAGAAFAAASLVALSPILVRNVIVGAPPFALAGKNAVCSFVQNNLPTYRWSESNVAFDPQQFGRIMGESDGSLPRAMRLCLAEHPRGLIDMLGIAAWKLDASFHWWDRPDNVNIYYYRLYAPVLRLPVTYWAVAVPGVIGLLLSLRRPRRHWPLYLLILGPLVQMVVFSVMARYRLPILLGLLPFASHALLQTTRWLLDARWQGFATLGAIVVLGAWTGRPMPPENPSLIRCCDAMAAFQVHYQPAILASFNAGQYADAAARFREFFDHAPPVVLRMNAAHPPRSYEEYELARVFAILDEDDGKILAHCPGAEDERLIRTRQQRDLEAAVRARGGPPGR